MEHSDLDLIWIAVDSTVDGHSVDAGARQPGNFSICE